MFPHKAIHNEAEASVHIDTRKKYLIIRERAVALWEM